MFHFPRLSIINEWLIWIYYINKYTLRHCSQQQYMSNILCGFYWEREVQYIYNPLLMKIEYRLIIWLMTAFPHDLNTETFE
jgi:hypothetical protein